jgi:dTDP-4-amino-4,6-dideoxygalactose transaminase
MEFIDLKTQYREIETGLNRRIEEIMRAATWINGKEVVELEARLAAYVGVKHCVACSSGTDALLMTLMARGIGPGDAIFVPDFTFFATAEVASIVHATPIFVDVKADTFNIDPCKLRAAIATVKRQGSLRPRAIIAVDLFGQPAEYDELEAIAKEEGLFLIEDAAQGFGGSIDIAHTHSAVQGVRKAGSFGDMAATSFFPAKPLGCYGDGGAVFTNNDGDAEILRSIREHGKGTDKYQNKRIGLNARLDTIQAAVLLEKLTIFDRELALRDAASDEYNAQLKDYLTTPKIRRGYHSAWAQYSVLARDADERDHVMTKLRTAGIPTAIYYPIPLHEQQVYSGREAEELNYVSEDICTRIFSLPMHPYLETEDIARISAVVKDTIDSRRTEE